jgi:hypothetical protein
MLYFMLSASVVLGFVSHLPNSLKLPVATYYPRRTLVTRYTSLSAPTFCTHLPKALSIIINTYAVHPAAASPLCWAGDSQAGCLSRRE